MAQLAFSMQQAHHMQEDDHRDGNAENPEEEAGWLVVPDADAA